MKHSATPPRVEAPAPFTVEGEPSTLDMTTPRDNLRWALSAIDLVGNGLSNRRKMAVDDDVELMNLKAARESVLAALTIIRASAGDGDRLDFAEQKAATIYCSQSGHWVFVDERKKTRSRVLGANGIRSCIDAAMKEGK